MKFKTPAYYSRKNINLKIRFIKDIIAIENKLCPGYLFTPAQMTKFNHIKETSGGTVEFDKESIIDGIPIRLNSNTSFNIEQSKMIKFNDHCTNDVGIIGLSDVVIKDSSKL